MKPFIENLGKYITNKTVKDPLATRNLLELIYGAVRFMGTHSLSRDVTNAYSYMTGVVAGTITDSFRHPERSVMVNIFFPCEVLHSMGLYPMFPEGISAYLANTGCQHIFAETAESNDVPETYCSYHKTMLGIAETGVMPPPLMIANTTLACDANQLSFRRLSEDLGVPHTVIDIPHTDNEDAIHYVADQLKTLTGQIEDLSGRKLDPEKLRETVDRSRRTLERYKEFVLRRASYDFPATMTGEMCSMITNHIMLGSPEAEIYSQKLLKLTKNHHERNDKKRIFWVHTLPNWQESMTSIFEYGSRCQIVGSDLSTDFFGPMDPDRPYYSMASRVVKSAYNGASENRIKRILDQAKLLQADGIIVFCHWGCKQTLGFSGLAKQAFEDAGFPTLVLDGDGCDSRNVADGQMVTRVNAFIEQLEGIQ